MSVPIPPTTRHLAYEAKRLLSQMSGTVAACYGELSRVEDGDRLAPRRAATEAEALRDQLQHLRALIVSLGGFD